MIEEALKQFLDHGCGLAALRAKVDRGFAEAEAGQLFTSEEAKAMLRARREQWLEDPKPSS